MAVVYRRYFRVTSGALIDAIEEVRKNRENPGRETQDLEGALNDVGIYSGPILFESEGCGYYATLDGSRKLGIWFVSVPWRDVDNAEIEQYKKARDEDNTIFNEELEHLLWEPPTEFEEVDKLQAEKELEEISEMTSGNENGSR